jgi:hypothetical protein
MQLALPSSPAPGARHGRRVGDDSSTLRVAGRLKSRLADGSALIAQHPQEPGKPLPTAGDRSLRVSPDLLATELGPFAGLPLPLHAPVGAPAP